MNNIKDKDFFEQFVKSKLDDYKAEIPPSGWDKLEGPLFATQKTKAIRRKWLVSSVAAVAAMLIGVIFVFQNMDRELPIQVSDLQNPKTESTVDISEATTDIKDSLSFEKKSPKIKEITPILITDNVSAEKDKTIDPNTSTSKTESSATTPFDKEDTQTTIKEQKDNYETSTIDDATKQQMIEDFINEGKRPLIPSEETKQSKRKRRISVSLTGQSGLLVSQNTNITPTTLRSSLSDAYGTYTIAKMGAFNKQEEIKPESEINHSQPVSFGLLTTFNLSQKLQLETGLIYTYLSSETKSKSMDYNESESMQFHYLGIPLNLNYTLLSINKLDLYLSAGAMIEKDIQGKLKYNDEKRNTLLNSKFASESSSNIKQQNPQLSLSSGVGIAYPLYNKVKLFGKVGGRYNINANNEYRTYYSDEKFGLDLQLGIKFNF